jgi:hypothetical protein
MSDFVCGANEADFHYTGVNWGRDLPEPDLVADIRNVVAGDPSPDGKGVLAIQRGIEVGHVFYLGTKYSVPMKATFLDENGKPQPFEMGCYGIGVTRILGAAIEQNHDERGMIWPAAMAPFAAVICPIGYDRSAEVQAAADKPARRDLAHWASTWCWTTAASARRDVRRLGTDRRAAARGHLRPRPEGRHGGSAGPPRSRGHGHATGRRAARREGPPGRHDAGAPRAASLPAGAAGCPGCAGRRAGRRTAGRCGAHRSGGRRGRRRAAQARFDAWKTAWPTCAGWVRPAKGSRSARPNTTCASSSSKTVWYESRRAGLETALVLGLIQVESGFRKYAISSAGARGYMQVMPFWARLIGDGDVQAPVPHADQPALSAA